jgi:hypothetical protein
MKSKIYEEILIKKGFGYYKDSDGHLIISANLQEDN